MKITRKICLNFYFFDKKISNYLDINVKFLFSSDIKKNMNHKAQDRLIEMSKMFNASRYVNPIGGIELYDKEAFSSAGINLSFLKSNEIIYKQFNDEFVSNLSIIDVIMFNSKDSVKKMLNHYNLI